MTKRLFIAIQLSPSIRGVLETYKPLTTPEIRWTKPENLHITTYFCGDTKEENIPALRKALEKIQAKPFELPFKEILFAPPHREPRMIWAEFARSEHFAKLTQKIYENVKEFLKDPEKPKQNPIPHVTLARFKNPQIAKDVQLEQPNVDTLQVTSYDLMESQLNQGGSKYTVLQSYALT